MRHAKLEWGYPPPRPNFIRRVRTALIAAAAGAAAGGIVVFLFVDRSVDKESGTLQEQSAQVASTPMLPLNPKRIDSESMKAAAAEITGHSESAAASLLSTRSTVLAPESSPLAEERTATYHELAKPMADGAKTSAGAVALLETNAPKRYRPTTSEARGGQRGFAPGKYYMRVGASAHSRHAHHGWVRWYQNAGWRYDSWN
jgi:hypothetical protein